MHSLPVAHPDQALLDRVLATVRAVEPGARVILFGSRARGDAAPDSDWDLLVLAPEPLTPGREQAIHAALLDLEHATGAVLEPLVRTAAAWDSRRSRATPLHANVARDGYELTPGGLARPVVDGRWGDDELAEERRDIIAYRLGRARRSLRAAETMAREEQWEDCVNCLYYACFYAVTALLVRDGRDPSKHTGVRGLFNQHYARTGLFAADLAAFYNTLFKARQEGDYADFAEFDAQTVRPWLPLARRLVEQAEALLAADEQPSGG